MVEWSEAGQNLGRVNGGPSRWGATGSPRIPPYQGHNSLTLVLNGRWNRSAAGPTTPGSSSKMSPRRKHQFRIRKSCSDQPQSRGQNLQRERSLCCLQGYLPVSDLDEMNEIQERWAYPLEIPVNDSELVDVGYTERDLRELKVVGQ